MKLIAFIPARLESKRFPNKILRKIYDLPMVEHVRRRALISKVFDKVYVVTNSTKVKKVINAYGGEVILSKKKHHNGTSRVSEIASKIKFDYGFILFGDEPFMNPNKILQCAKKIKKDKIDIYNVVTNLEKNDLKSKHVVKSLIKSNYIIDYFRIKKKIPSNINLKKSSGLLILNKKILVDYNNLIAKKKEKNLKIEQFRFLENDISIKPIYIRNIYPSINTKKEFADLIKVINKNKKESRIINKIKNNLF